MDPDQRLTPNSVDHLAASALRRLPLSALGRPPLSWYALRRFGDRSTAASDDYRRFVVLCNGRSGSTVFMGALQTHPQVVAHLEVFHARIAFVDGAEPAIERWITGVRNHGPDAFVERLVFGPRHPSVRAVGFKVFASHLTDARFADAIRRLATDDMTYIHLRRPNKLAVALSLMRAEEEGRWTHSPGADRSPRSLDPEWCEEAFERLEREDLDIRALAGDRPVLDLTYGELSDDFVGTMDAVQDRLGLDRVELHPTLTRQRSGTLRDNIENFDELAARFAGTRHARFFDLDWAEQ